MNGDDAAVRVRWIVDASGLGLRFPREAGDPTYVLKVLAPFLADIDPAVLEMGMRYFVATARFMPTPYEIRRQCAVLAGAQLAPPWEEVLAECVRMSEWERDYFVGDRRPKPEWSRPAAIMYGRMGGREGIGSGTDPAMRAQFRESYNRLAEDHDRRALLGSVARPQLGRSVGDRKGLGR